jgi:site-specific DNA-cytosine methylase
MNVLSLFDGMSCGRIALERAGVRVHDYFSSEIDKFAQVVSQANYPNIVRLGDVRNWKEWNLPKIDLVIGGSPCQGFSDSGKKLNFDDPRSKLFFEFVDIVRALKPKYFLLENVKMKPVWSDVISEYMHTPAVEINSSCVSAQFRERLYWTNINFNLPLDRGIILSDVLELDVPYIKTDKKFNPKRNQHKASTLTGGAHSGGNHSDMDILVYQYPRGKNAGGYSRSSKSSTVTSSRWENNNFILGSEFLYRRYTPVECERLQTVPDNYTAHVSNTQRYKMLGNGWTVDVVANIFTGL